MIDYCEGVCDVLDQRQRIARKEHRCSECRRVIEVGEKYLFEAIAYDGTVDTIKTCAHCQVARKWLSAECGGFVYEGVREDLHEHIEEAFPGHYGKGVIMLDVGISRRWRKKDGTLWRVPSVPKTTHERAAATAAVAS